MRREIALQLLHETMLDSGLEEEERTSIFLELESLAKHKYDTYELYRPGRLFLENLYVWLTQFKGEQKKIALEFAAKQLVYISRNEIHQLATILYDDIIRPILKVSVATQLNISEYRIKEIFSSKEFDRLHRSTLFLAMSDGSRLDYFRRQNREIGNEQTVPYYLVDKNKFAKMRIDLANDLIDDSAKFKYVFLIDDFCGSGRTFLREQTKIDIECVDDLPEIPIHLQAILQIDKIEHKMVLKCEGAPSESDLNQIRMLSDSEKFLLKINQLVKLQHDKNVEIVGSFIKLMSSEGFDGNILDESVKIYYSPFLITEYAFNRLNKIVHDNNQNDKIARLQVKPVCIIPDSIRISKGSHPISSICEEYYLDKMGDEHTGDIKYGYSGCGLPLIMHHNTPNNSIYLLWCARNNFEPLFNRYERHGRESK